MPAGTLEYHSSGFPASACVMNLCQIGAAPTIPVELWLRGLLSGFPTQTAVARLGVNPTVQLSLKSFVVPVFAATWRPGSVRSPWQPNDMQRLRSSDMMLAMMKATLGSRSEERRVGKECRSRGGS